MPKAGKERRRAHRLTRKIITFLLEDEDGWRIELRPLYGRKRTCASLGFGSSNIVGCVDWEQMLIVVDPRYEALSTLIHEVLHVLYDETPEAEILGMEQLCAKHLTRRQAEEIWCYATLLMNVTFTVKG